MPAPVTPLTPEERYQHAEDCLLANDCPEDAEAVHHLRAALAKAESEKRDLGRIAAQLQMEVDASCNAEEMRQTREERDAALARVTALTEEVEAWREAFDWQYTEKYRLMLDKARRLRAQNERKEEPR